MKFLLVSLIFLKRSLVFPILFFSSISFHWSLKKAFLSLLAILWNSDAYIFPFLLCFLVLFFSQLFVRPPETAILLFLHFFSMGMVLLPVSCTMSRTSVHRSSGSLSIRSRWLQSMGSQRVRHDWVTSTFTLSLTNRWHNYHLDIFIESHCWRYQGERC